MTAQERELLTSFLEQMRQTQAGQKDPAAEDLIKQAVAGQPDAAYLLVQRAVGLDYALRSVQAELAKAQAELQQLRSGQNSSFIDSAGTWGRSAKAPAETPPGMVAQANFSPAFSPSSLARPATPAAAPAAAGGWGSGMLGNVATTAAGVVAGAFLFQGIQGLMGHHGAAQGDAAKAGDTSASSVPPPSLPPQQMAAADQAPEDVDAAIDDAYADSGDAGDTGDSA